MGIRHSGYHRAAHVLHIPFPHLPTLSWKWGQHPGRNKARTQSRSCLFILALPKLVYPWSSLFSISDECSCKHRPKICVKSRQITSLASSPSIWLTMSLKKLIGLPGFILYGVSHYHPEICFSPRAFRHIPVSSTFLQVEKCIFEDLLIHTELLQKWGLCVWLI